jgi:hypothetical protein
LAKRDLWGLEAEPWFVVASYAFAKLIPPIEELIWQKYSLLNKT